MIKAIIIAIFFLISCQVKDSEQNNVSDGLNISKNDNSIFIKDSIDYSVRFLKEMENLGLKNVSLVDSFLILEDNDTMTFPQTPIIGKITVLTGKKDELAISLTVTRINQTTIYYKIEIAEFGNANYTYEGQADLHPRFYFGSETDESSVSGISYLSTEFSDEQDSCYTNIRLGREEESGPYLLGKIIKNCNGKLKDIELDNFPTLIEK